MNINSRINRILIFSLILLTMLSCLLPSANTVTATPTPNISGAGGSGNNGGNGGPSGPGGGNGSGGSGGPDSSLTEIPTPEPTQQTGGPYIVQQTRHAGDESISGQVCSVTSSFVVTFVTGTVTFTISFVPADATHGTLSYAYNFADLGESHNATGTYTLHQIEDDGTLQLNMSASDHVVFNGFDGNIPMNYQFNLVPSMSVICP